MEKQNLKQFTEIMMGLAENYPGAVLTGNGLKFRFAALKEFSIDQVISSATKLIQTHRYNSMPTVGDIINAMDGVVRINTEQRAEIEAGKVLDHLHYFGSQVTPFFDDPITKHLMGHRWRYHSWASRVKADDLKWWSRDFVRAYKAHAASTKAGFYLPMNSEVHLLPHTVGSVVEKKKIELTSARRDACTFRQEKGAV